MSRLRGKKILYCFGDSHAKMFRFLDQNDYLSQTLIRCHIVGGATAMGMVNPNSKTNALNIFRERIKHISPYDYLLIMLGEVDCGFVIWYRAAKYKVSVETQLAQSLSNYRVFINELIADRQTRLIICSAPIPTIFDDAPRGEIAHARREVTATLEARTNLTLQYNGALKRICQEQDLHFLDFSTEILDVQTGVINKAFLNRDPLDHHLEPSTIAPFLTEKLQRIGFR
jgi:hypothetical protein